MNSVTVEELYKTAKQRLQEAGIDSPAFDALCIIEKVFGFDRTALIARGDTKADDKSAQLFCSLVERRCSFEPLQYILGSWSFMGCDFAVGKGVLIPREDTCEVVNLCIESAGPNAKLEILDLCSGSGAIAVVLAKAFKNSNVTAVELSPRAFEYLEKNIKSNGVSVKAMQKDIFTCFDDFPDNSFDIIVSNPPYVISDEIKTLQKEVRMEPSMALDGGEDGLDFYRFITSQWTKKLKCSGVMAFELGENQFDDVRQMMLAQGLENIKFKVDLGGTQRAIIGTLLKK